jgi:hypothetical protein
LIHLSVLGQKQALGWSSRMQRKGSGKYAPIETSHGAFIQLRSNRLMEIRLDN